MTDRDSGPKRIRTLLGVVSKSSLAIVEHIPATSSPRDPVEEARTLADFGLRDLIAAILSGDPAAVLSVNREITDRREAMEQVSKNPRPLIRVTRRS